MKTVVEPKVSSERQSTRVLMEYGLGKNAIAPPYYRALGLCRRRVINFKLKSVRFCTFAHFSKMVRWMIDTINFQHPKGAQPPPVVGHPYSYQYTVQ